jgi:hypothetical protein
MFVRHLPKCGWPNTPVTRQLKYTVPDIFYLLEISAPQFQASTQALDTGVFGEKCPGIVRVFPVEKEI